MKRPTAGLGGPASRHAVPPCCRPAENKGSPLAPAATAGRDQPGSRTPADREQGGGPRSAPWRGRPGSPFGRCRSLLWPQRSCDGWAGESLNHRTTKHRKASRGRLRLGGELLFQCRLDHGGEVFGHHWRLGLAIGPAPITLLAIPAPQLGEQQVAVLSPLLEADATGLGQIKLAGDPPANLIADDLMQHWIGSHGQSRQRTPQPSAGMGCILES